MWRDLFKTIYSWIWTNIHSHSTFLWGFGIECGLISTKYRPTNVWNRFYRESDTSFIFKFRFVIRLKSMLSLDALMFINCGFHIKHSISIQCFFCCSIENQMYQSDSVMQAICYCHSSATGAAKTNVCVAFKEMWDEKA